MKFFIRNLLKWLLLSFVWFALSNLDFYRLEISDLSGNTLFWRALMAMIDTMLISLVIVKSRKNGPALVTVLFLALFGMKTVLTVVESAYLPMLRPLIMPLLINGLVASLLFIVVSVLVWNAGYESSNEANNKVLNWRKPWFQWAWKLPFSAVIWMILFVIFGALVFLNVANYFDPQGLANYNNLDMPSWVLPFQGLRALLWLGLTMPLIIQLNGTKFQVAGLVASIFAGWMGSNLLLALDIPAGLRFAHLLEVGGESFVFGFVIIFLLAGRQQKDAAEEKDILEVDDE